MECKEFLLSRRSVRKFEDKPVPLDLVIKAIEIARFAPSAWNRQPWEFIIVTDKTKINALANVHKWARPVSNSNLAVIVFSRKDVSPNTHLVDGSIATTYFWLGLHCVGLTTVWILATGYEEKIREILKAPEELVPIAIFPIGYPAEKPKTPARKSLQEIISLETHGNRYKS